MNLTTALFCSFTSLGNIALAWMNKVYAIAAVFAIFSFIFISECYAIQHKKENSHGSN